MFSVEFEKLTLSNGLDLILHEDHTLPVVAVNVWYHVGSKDETPGKTGFAHLFEHVMFEGSKHHDRSHFEPLEKVGANLNGSTTNDRTNYWENVPSNYLELALWLEADRMGFLLDVLDQQRFDIQRDVVKNERRQSYENRPYGLSSMLIQPAVFPLPHPYHWMTIGSQDDLDAASLDDVKEFFSKYYLPSNASLALAGDFDSQKAKEMVDQYFGELPPGAPVHRIGRMDSNLPGQVDLTMRDKVALSRLYLVWPSVSLFDTNEAALDILGVILGDGKSSRLYRSLVYEKQMAQDVAVHNYSQEIAGEFMVQVTAAPGHNLSEIHKEIEKELDLLRREPPTSEELIRAKNRIESQHVRQMERIGGFGGRADLLNMFNTYTGDPGGLNSDVDRYLVVERENIQQMASWLVTSNKVKLSVLPEHSYVSAPSVVDRTIMPSPAVLSEFNPPVPKRGKLSNGLDLLVMEKRGLPIVSFGLYLHGGGMTDPVKLPGLDQFMVSMLPEGTTSRSSHEISDRMEYLGSHIWTESGRENVMISADALTTRWSDAIAVLADVIRNPTFPEEELKRIRRERVTDLRRVSEDSAVIAARASRALMYGPDSAYGHPSSGTVPSVEAMSRDDLLGHFRCRYGPEAATLIIVGDVEIEEAVSVAEANFGDWSPVATRNVGDTTDVGQEQDYTTTIYLANKPGAAQSFILSGFQTIPRAHHDFHTMILLNDVFGGQFSARLNLNLRQDKGYSYGYMSSIEWLTGPSAFIAGGAVQTTATKQSVDETLREFSDISKDRPVTVEEFEASRDGLLRGFPANFESQRQLLGQLARLVMFELKDDYLSGYLAELQAVSLEDVQRVATERLSKKQLKILVVGDQAVVESGLREFGLPLVLIDHEGRELV